VIIPII